MKDPQLDMNEGLGFISTHLYITITKAFFLHGSICYESYLFCCLTIDF